MIPAQFRGAWRRVSLSLDGGPAHEPAHVVWLQASSAFADLRVPLGGTGAEPESFAGTTSWHDPELRWRHELDLTSPDGGVDDRGQMSWDGQDLVEEGTFVDDGRVVPYVEVWRRLDRDDPDGPNLALSRAHAPGFLVRVGDHALTIVDDRPRGGAYRASYRTRRQTTDASDADEWATVLTLEHAADAVPAPPRVAPRPGEASIVLRDEQWNVLPR